LRVVLSEQLNRSFDQHVVTLLVAQTTLLGYF
jgi:hypothetical protein